MRTLSFSAGNRVELLRGGAQFFPALVAAIDAAQQEIYLETYIFAADTTAVAIQQALTRAAVRGVDVKVITDWVGTGHGVSGLLQQEFVRHGVGHRSFNPWFRGGIARTHRKLCVVDKAIAFIGGINIIDDLQADDGSSFPLSDPRLDFAVCLQGPLVATVHREIEVQWSRLGSLKQRMRWKLSRNKHSTQSMPDETPILATLVVRDNLRNRRTIQRACLQALGRAQHRVIFANPYFAPGRKLRRALEQTAARGVDVTLLLGVGQYRLQDAIAHSFYPKLLQSGVKLVEYHKTHLHAKVAVIDDDWATVGSSNYDGLSLFVNQEANIVIKDVDFCDQLRTQIELALADGVVVNLSDYANIPWYKRAWYGIAYLLYETLFRIATWSKYT